MFIVHIDMQGLDIPDFFCIVTDGAVTGEHAHFCDIGKTFFLPCFGSVLEFGNHILCCGVRLKVSAAHVRIVHDVIQERPEEIPFAG